MSSYIVTVTVLGAIILMTAWLPMVLRRLPLSLPTVCIGLGVLLALSPLSFIAATNPLENREVKATRLIESSV